MLRIESSNTLPRLEDISRGMIFLPYHRLFLGLLNKAKAVVAVKCTMLPCSDVVLPIVIEIRDVSILLRIPRCSEGGHKSIRIDFNVLGE